MVSLSIVAVLTGLGLSFSWKKLLHKTERAGCEGKLRSFHMALNNYMADQGHWPQLPEEFMMRGSEESYWEWWYATLADYDITEKHWLCPTDERERRAGKPEDRDKFESSYCPTNFDQGRNTPFQDPQPWVLERSDFHGSGNLMIMPDGSIQTAPWLPF